MGKPDVNAGELPVAFIQLKAGLQATPDELIEFTNKQVAAYKKLREVKLIQLIPVSATGKVLRRKLRDQVAG